MKCCRASGSSPGVDPTRPSVRAACVFLKANFATTPPQIPDCFHLCSCLPAPLRNPTFHLRTYLGLPACFSNSVYVNKEFAFSGIVKESRVEHLDKNNTLDFVFLGDLNCVVVWFKIQKKAGNICDATLMMNLCSL